MYLDLACLTIRVTALVSSARHGLFNNKGNDISFLGLLLSTHIEKESRYITYGFLLLFQ